MQSFYDLRDNPSNTLLSEHEVSLTLQIAEAVHQAGGRALVVGGYVRDQVMRTELGHELETKDVDLEVYGLSLADLQKLLEPIHAVAQVGASFGVLKVGPLDVSVPRKDGKTAKGHRGFTVEADPQLSHKDAARRRDFTINAMALDPLSGQLLDEWGGVNDVQAKMLRAVDQTTFPDDPLRSLRAMQFAGRFGFSIEPTTMKLCRSLDLRELSPERIGEEWTKLLLKADKPSVGLQAARELGIIEQLHPQLAALIDTPQEPDWHPEGSVWNHTLMTIDVAAGIIRREELPRDDAVTVMYGSLCHDFGKPEKTHKDVKTGRIRSSGHAEAGVPLAMQFMQTLALPQLTIKKVQKLVHDHMFLPEVQKAKDSAIRRLAKRLQPATVQELLWVTEADFCGRALKDMDLSLLRRFQERADELAVANAAMAPLVLGRDLIQFGIQPGKQMGDILAQLYAAQEDGAFTTHQEGIDYYKQHIAPKL